MRKTFEYRGQVLRFWGKPHVPGEYYLHVQASTESRARRKIVTDEVEAEELAEEMAEEWKANIRAEEEMKKNDEKKDATGVPLEGLPDLASLDLDQLLALQARASQLAAQKQEEAEAEATRAKIVEVLAGAPLDRLRAAYAALTGTSAAPAAARRKSSGRPRSERFKLPAGPGHFANAATGQVWAGRGRWPAWAEEAREKGTLMDMWVPTAPAQPAADASGGTDAPTA